MYLGDVSSWKSAMHMTFQPLINLYNLTVDESPSGDLFWGWDPFWGELPQASAREHGPTWEQGQNLFTPTWILKLINASSVTTIGAPGTKTLQDGHLHGTWDLRSATGRLGGGAARTQPPTGHAIGENFQWNKGCWLNVGWWVNATKRV